jgi:hypothetical protein
MKKLLSMVLVAMLIMAIVPTTLAKTAGKTFELGTKAGENVVLFDEIAAADTTTMNYKIAGTDFAVEDGMYVYRFAANASGAVKTYGEGEIAWFNFGLDVFDMNADAENVTMQAVAYAGTENSLNLANAYVTSEKGFGMKVTAAEANTKVVFEVMVDGADDMLANQFDAYLVISSAKADITAAKEGEATEVVAPMGNAMAVANVTLNAVELEGGKIYPATIQGEGRVWFMDKNMNILSNAWGENAELALTPMVDGTYYVAADKAVTVGNPVEGGEFAIDLANLTNADDHYAYHMFENQLAVLELVEPGTYTLTGEAANTVLYIHNAGIKVVLDNAKISNVQIDALGCVEIAAVGESEITGSELVDEPAAIYSVPAAKGVLAITGEKLNVEGKTGISLLNMGLYIDAALAVKTTGVENEAGVAAQVYGQFVPAITLGRPINEDNLAVVKTYFDEAMKYQYGVAIGEEDICIFGEKAEAPEFSMFEVLYGDANRDGKVNTADAVAILRHAATLVMLGEKAMLNADVNLDGSIDTVDATIILQFAAGMVLTLPVEA